MTDGIASIPRPYMCSFRRRRGGGVQGRLCYRKTDSGQASHRLLSPPCLFQARMRSSLAVRASRHGPHIGCLFHGDNQGLHAFEYGVSGLRGRIPLIRRYIYGIPIIVDALLWSVFDKNCALAYEWCSLVVVGMLLWIVAGPYLIEVLGRPTRALK